VDFNLWLPLFGICLLGAMSPGPSLGVVVSYTLRDGRTGGVLAGLAHGLGVGLYGVATVVGLGALLLGSGTLFAAVQLSGAAYLAWLGLQLTRSAGGVPGAQGHVRLMSGRPLRDGFLIAFLNPKLALFMFALFAQFLSPGASLGQKSIMVATVGITDASWYCLVALGLSHPALYERLQRYSRYIDRGFGAVLLTLAAVIALRVLLGAA